MKTYLDCAREILIAGSWKQNRTGVRTQYLTGQMLTHQMSLGFPLLTTKKMNFTNVAIELEFFIRGLRNKRWLQERDCHIWDAWCNPVVVPYGNDDESKKKMAAEPDLGLIYGVMWRRWPCDERDASSYIDQFKNVVDTLQKNPMDRRMIVSAWNPEYLNAMALPPCHFAWQVLSDGQKLDLVWYQRSCDFPVGVPYNMASYGLLLELIAQHVNMIPNRLVGFLADSHIYENQIDLMFKQCEREPRSLPRLSLTHNGNIYDWTYKDATILDYDPHPFIKYPVNV